MFRIKICGITRLEDAQTAVAAGADAIGLNFYEKSSRYLTQEKQTELLSVTECARVGVFVNADRDSIAETGSRNRLDVVQLHGDEPPEMLPEIDSSFRLILARRMDDRGVAPIAADLAACRAAGRLPDAVLVDAHAPGSYGGTGETVSWESLVDYRQVLGDVPLILAGGLNPENVAEAIRIVQPYGVDVASGVESSPGVKCPEKVRLFVSRAQAAFARL